MKVHLVRDRAVQCLITMEKEHVFSSQLLNRYEKDFEESRDRSLLREYTYGVLENRTYLDYVIDTVSSKKSSKLRIPLKNILRLAVYELVILKTPAHAAINEAVKLVKKYDFHASGFANGVLRSIDRNGLDIEIMTEDKLTKLSIRYSHPKWMIEYLRKYFAGKELEILLKKNNMPSPISIFVNPKKISVTEAMEELYKEGFVDVKKSEISKYSLIIEKGSITETKLFKDGKITIQSQPSIKAAEIAVEGFEKLSNLKILDLCAAPGSKSMAMSLLCDSADITSNDLTENKIEKIKENAERLGAENISYSVYDATKLNEEWIDAFDIVLLDAPCSGLGLLRRKPDIRWNREEYDIESLAAIQKKILDNAIKYVKNSGRLVYSTCTFGEAENEKVVSRLNKSECWEPELINNNNYLKYSSLDEDADGFFISRFKKIRKLELV